MKQIQNLIEELSQEPGFSTVVLTDNTGLSLAAAGDLSQAQSLAALVGEILRLGYQAGRRLEMGGMSDMIMLYDEVKQGILCRQFTAGQQTLILAVVIQPNEAYWPATSRAIRQVQESWSFQRA